jgi:hypothetical protein
VCVTIGSTPRLGGASFGVFFLGFFTSRLRASLFPMPNSMPRIAPTFQDGKFQEDPLPTERRTARNGCATKAGLLLALSDETEVGAEVEALDADLKRSAAAMEQVFEQGLQE